MAIEMNRRYKYANGKCARILCVDYPDLNQPVLSMEDDGMLRAHRGDGTSASNSAYDLVDEWEHWKIDTPVRYKQVEHAAWSNGYWAGIRYGKPAVWAHGATSWSTKTGEYVYIFDATKVEGKS